jgi:predicted RNA polymerase sigma factor
LSALPANLKEPLILCALQGMSQEEAAAVLGVSRKTVETRIYRARQRAAARPSRWPRCGSFRPGRRAVPQASRRATSCRVSGSPTTVARYPEP